MRFLVDEALSASVAEQLSAAAHDAVHLSDLGMLGATDVEVMEVARTQDRVLVTADTDFAELLAIGTHVAPSVILMRRAPHAPTAQALLILSCLPLTADDLERGAVVVLSPETVRIRTLPIPRSG